MTAKFGSLRNFTSGAMLSSQAILLTSFWGRFLGKLAPGLPPEAIIGLSPCDWIHTFGLRRPLDVAYCDGSGQVLSVTFGQGPHRLACRVRGARTTWEAPAGGFAGQVSVGDVLEWLPDAGQGSGS